MKLRPKTQRSWSYIALASLFGFTSCMAFSQPVQFGETTQLFAHFVIGEGWTTYATVNNPTREAQTITIELFRSDGSLLLSQDVQLNPSETKSIEVDPSPTRTTGWARFSSTERFSSALLSQFHDSGRVISEARLSPV